MMTYIYRFLEENIKLALARKKSILLLGPRQTGKTTLIASFELDFHINLMNPNTRQSYESHPGKLIDEIRFLADKLARPPLVFIDEIQKVPTLMDVLQVLIDDQVAQCIISGSSARQIRNFLPGRAIRFQLDPLTHTEFLNKPKDLAYHLIYGDLPGLFSIQNDTDRDSELRSYVTNYLEEEIRKESLVRNLSAFSQFLHLACVESGNTLSFRNLSQEIGVAHSTIADYYRILEECMLVERFNPITTSTTRKRLTKTPKFIIFDLGVRRTGAKEGSQLSVKQLSHLFEQWVGLELRRLSHQHPEPLSVEFWRDHGGPEVDWVLRLNNRYYPIEVKWTSNPKPSDLKHLHTFINEYSCETGLLICQCEHPQKISPTVTAIPWQQLEFFIKKWLTQ